MNDASDEIILRQDGRLGRITLNRPKAINALSLGMVQTMRAALERWHLDLTVGCVLIDGAGERGLCAGGDVRAIWESLRADGSLADRFWQEEYALNAMIAAYAKPMVAFMDGVVMGGGVGISAHASHRVVTERAAVAMPETIIGFTPDVGASYLLSRAPGSVGLRLALTGSRMDAGDAIYCGLADRFVPSERLAALAVLLSRGPADEAIETVAAAPPEASLALQRGWIDAAYSGETVEAIVTALQARPEPQAAADAEELGMRSPTSLKVTLRSIRSAATLAGLEACLAQELRLTHALTRLPDFMEGVRAQLIDKDRAPKWSPATLAEVSEAVVAACFQA
jgi:enoyl-CoA hydratase